MTPKSKDTKNRIISTAYELFRDHGFHNTSIEQITKAAHCSVGTFYHYFNSKEALLIVWVENYDAEYKEWFEQINPEMHTLEKLDELNKLVFELIEARGDVDATALVYAHIMQFRRDFYNIERDRYYNRLLQNLLREGQNKGEISKEISYIELAKMCYAAQRGVIFEWCLASGSYSLKEFGVKFMHLVCSNFRA